jgi:hypothetical protein
MLRARSIYFKPFIYAARKEYRQKNLNTTSNYLDDSHNKNAYNLTLTYLWRKKKSIFLMIIFGI